MSSVFSKALEAVVASPALLFMVKITLLLGLGLTIAWLLRRRRAAIRHVILAATLLGLAVVPVLSSASDGYSIGFAVDERPPVASALPAADAAVSSTLTPSAGPIAVTPEPDASSAAGATSNKAATSRLSVNHSLGLGLGLALAWLAGMLWLLASLAIDLLKLRRLRRAALPALSIQQQVRELAKRRGIQRTVSVVVSDVIASPITCGLFRPTLVLPVESLSWGPSWLHRCLLHELEHVRRNDWATQVFTLVVASAYWFHPLIWIAWRSMCLEAEQASDDAVLLAIGDDDDATAYADQLVALARVQRRAAMSSVTIGMAKRSDLAKRIDALVSTDQGRGRLRPRAAMVSMLGAAIVLTMIAPLRVHAAGALGPALRLASEPLVPEVQAPLGRLNQHLYESAGRGDLAAIDDLLAQGANANAVLLGAGSPLIHASRAGKLSAALRLLDHGADPNLGVRGDGSPLIASAKRGQIEIVRLLLSRGANVDQVVPGDESALIAASAAGHLDVVELLIESGANVNLRAWAPRYRAESEWRAPRGMAEQRGHDSVAAMLRNAGATR